MKRSRLYIPGCFDLLHQGHLKLLNLASLLGEVYVGLNSDSSLESLKDRTVFDTFQVRKNKIKKLNVVKMIVKINDEDDIITHIKRNKIDFIVKGVDTIHDRIYKSITGHSLVKGILFLDHYCTTIHSSDLLKGRGIENG